MHENRHWMDNPRVGRADCPLKHAGTRADPANGARTLAVGAWTLAVGAWTLAVGAWTLAVGARTLAVGARTLAMLTLGGLCPPLPGR